MEPNPNFATAALEAIPKTASQVLVVRPLRRNHGLRLSMKATKGK
jgi:hypothetical protein